MILDTHATVKKFIKLGFEEAQAEAVVEAINEQNQNLATKKDLEVFEIKFNSKIDSLEARIDSRMVGIEQTVATKQDLSEVKVEILKWLIPMFLTIIGLILGMYFK